MGYQAYTQARDASLRNLDSSLNALDEGRQARVSQAAGNALQSGDYSGASAAMFEGGNVAGGLAIQTAGRTAQTADRERTATALVAGVAGLQAIPEGPERLAAFQQRVLPFWRQSGLTDEQLAQIDPNTHLTDAFLNSLTAQYGGERQAAPSGYRWRPDGTQEAVPGGPEDPKNQRWQVTPYGMIPPAGWSPPQGGQGAAPEYVDQLPPGVRPRPNQAPPAPAAGGAERNQPVGVSFRSTDQARTAIEQAVPGVSFTSGTRDAATNKRVGGVPNSNHVRGRAWDLVPPRGMTMAQLAQKARTMGLRALDEGDHVHVSW